MTISPVEVKKLREQTGAGMMDAKKALLAAKGDFGQALVILRKSGREIAQKKQGRAVKEGCIGHYIHSNGKVAALVELLCETDFVARNEEFKNLAHEIAMQIAAMNPLFLGPSDIPQAEIAKEKEILSDSAVVSGKPAAVRERIIAGKLEKYYSEVCLLKQPYFKDDKVLIEDLIKEAVAKLKENIQIGRFIYLNL